MSDFWEEFKDAFKTKKQREKEKAEKLKDALAAEKAVDEKMDNLENEYQSYLDSQKEEIDLEALFPTSLGLEKIEYTPESDESISDRATAQNVAEKTKEVNSVDEKYGARTDTLKDKLDDAEKSHAQKDKDLEELYDSLRKSGFSDGVKRGTARGSIVSSLIDSLNSGESTSREEAYKNYLDGVEAINAEMSKLNEEKQIALDELDLKYASSLDKQIAKLKEERDATVAKYVKYNNNVEEKEQKYAVQRQKDVEKFLEEQEKAEAKKEEEQREYEAKYGYSGEKLQNYNERYRLAYDFYMSLDADIAESALDASPNMKYYLGNYYSKLKAQLAQRTSDTSLRKFY